MYINRRSYPRAYKEILASARASSSSGSSSSSTGQVSVLILVAPDVDALCACRILVGLLKHDQIGYNVVPVSGWSELARVNREMVDGDGKLRTVILLNLGSLVDLSQFFTLPEQATLHVIDSHRPCNLDNLFSAQPEAERIVVWDDGDVDEDMKEEKEAFEALQYEPESDSEEEFEDTDDEDLHWRERQRRLLADSDESGSSDEEGDSDSSSRGKRRRLDEDGNEVESSGDGKGKSGKNGKAARGPKRMSKKRKLLHRGRIQKYYASGTSYGQSVAGQLYVLATLLRRADNDYLWLGILGLTYQFTANLIDREKYDNYASLLTNEVERLNIEHAPRQAAGNGFSSIHNPDDRSIRQSDEFRFMLFRHWNLYDAMYHSGYVAGKLKLWRDRGRKNLQGLLAKMGFSLEQCRQSYAHMDMDLKRSLKQKVEGIAPEYGLHDLSYPSFVRAYGYQSILSAGDATECVSALLEVANGVRLDFGNEIGGAVWSGAKTWNSGIGKEDGGEEEAAAPSSDKENQGPNGQAQQNGNGAVVAAGGLRAEEAAAVAAAKAKKREEAWWVRNFWMAYDSLGQDTMLLRSSLPLSMALHRAIIRQGISILDKQTIKTLRTFRFCIIKEGPDLSVFAHPATLSRLATWLVDAVRDLLDNPQNKTRVKALPFILAALDEKRDTFLVVGITGAAEYGDVRKNRFGLAFQEAAHTSGTRTRHDKFEASVVEVRKDDLAAFIQRIQIKL